MTQLEDARIQGVIQDLTTLARLAHLISGAGPPAIEKCWHLQSLGWIEIPKALHEGNWRITAYGGEVWQLFTSNGRPPQFSDPDTYRKWLLYMFRLLARGYSDPAVANEFARRGWFTCEGKDRELTETGKALVVELELTYGE